MLEPLLRSALKEKILLFIYSNKEAYARQMARRFHCALAPVQRHLNNLENTGVLVCQKRGRTNAFRLDPRFPFRKELDALIEKRLYFTDASEKEEFYTPRLRPRRRHKPL